MRYVHNITDINFDRGFVLRVMRRPVGIRRYFPIPDELYKRFKGKLDRLVSSGHIYIGGKVLPRALRDKRQRARKPVVVPEPEPQPDIDELKGRDDWATPILAQLSDLDAVLKQTLVDALSLIDGADTTGTKTVLRDRLAGLITDHTVALPFDSIHDLFFPEE
jgi:hypothetical protein